MASDSFVHVRVDAAEKQAAEQVLDALGLNMATTIRLLLKQIARENGCPFLVSDTGGKYLCRCAGGQTGPGKRFCGTGCRSSD